MPTDRCRHDRPPRAAATVARAGLALLLLSTALVPAAPAWHAPPVLVYELSTPEDAAGADAATVGEFVAPQAFVSVTWRLLCEPAGHARATLTRVDTMETPWSRGCGDWPTRLPDLQAGLRYRVTITATAPAPEGTEVRARVLVSGTPSHAEPSADGRVVVYDYGYATDALILEPLVAGTFTPARAYADARLEVECATGVATLVGIGADALAEGAAPAPVAAPCGTSAPAGTLRAGATYLATLSTATGAPDDTVHHIRLRVTGLPQ